MKKIISRVFMIAVSALAGMLLVEWAASWRTNRSLELMGFYATPGEVIDGIPINAQGFAGDAVNHPKPEGTLRVLTLGGSVLFNEHMSERLKAAIQPVVGREVELAGGALRNHTSASSLIKYKYYFSSYDFDVVLIYEGINDLWMNHYDRNDFNADYSHDLPHYRRDVILDNCLSCRIIYNILNSDPRKRVPQGSGYLAEESFEKNLRELIALIRQQGAKPVLMTFASYIPPDYSDEKFEQRTAGYSADIDSEGDYWPIAIWGAPDYVQEGLRRHNAITRKLATELQVDLIDQEAMFDAEPDLKPLRFGDICHFSNVGVDFFVDNVARYFSSRSP